MQSGENILILFFGLCCMMIAFLDDIEFEIQTLNKATQVDKFQPIRRRAFLQNLNNIVQFHADVKQLSRL